MDDADQPERADGPAAAENPSGTPEAAAVAVEPAGEPRTQWGRARAWVFAQRPERAPIPPAADSAQPVEPEVAGAPAATEGPGEGAGDGETAEPVPAAELIAEHAAARRPHPRPHPAAEPEPLAAAEPDAAEQQPEAAADPQVAEPETGAAESEVAEPETEVAEPETEVAEPETEVAEPEPGTVAEPAAAAEAAQGDVPSGPKRRPRPSPRAPLVYDSRPEAGADKQPGDSFFERSGDEDERSARTRSDSRSAAGPATAAAETSATGKKGAESPAKKRGSTGWTPGGLLRRARSLVIVAVLVVAGALALRAYVVESFYVPSASMEPTLHGCPTCNDDHVLVEKLTYLFHDPQPGDVVVFDRPSSWNAVSEPVLIKRVIGVAGDVLTIRHGHVFRGKEQLDEPYVNTKCRYGTTPVSGQPGFGTKTYRKIPNGYVFVMGDNRCNSEDSRVEGLVPVDNIVGKAFMIVWPLSRLHSL